MTRPDDPGTPETGDASERAAGERVTGEAEATPAPERDAATAADAPYRSPGTGAIYDLGYARYAGERLPPSTLWRVILRQQLSHSWKTWWRYKAWLAGAVVTTIVVGLIMYLRRTDTVEGLVRITEGMRDRPGMEDSASAVSFLDAAIIYGYRVWIVLAFLLTMTVVAPLIARDRESGAFTFYFARPVRARDYVAGKIGGMLAVMATIFLAGPLVLAIFRMSLAHSTDELIGLASWLPRVLVVGTVATVAYATIPLAFSALAPRRTQALGLWAAYYVVFTSTVMGIALNTWPPAAAIDPAISVMSLAIAVFDLHTRGQEIVPLWAALVSLLAQSGVAVFLVRRQITAHAQGAVGAS